RQATYRTSYALAGAALKQLHCSRATTRDGLRCFVRGGPDQVQLSLHGASRGRRPLTSHVRTLHMSWSREGGGRSGPRGYHHGNLKEALIRAALELIAQKGPAGFTFAEAARWAGVSPAAPYRHFRDRDAL